jgi:two-component system, OmpR family, response regulator MprA
LLQLPAVEPSTHLPSESARILVIDDDATMRASIQHCLHAVGYRVLEAADGAQGLELARAEKPALIVLDVVMPVLGGLETAAELRRLGDTTPILMLTTRQEVPERVGGLMAGADDYLGKPFDRRELLARVHALLRRELRQSQNRRVLHFGPVTIDLEHKTATRGDMPLPLTRTEFALLELLAAHLGSPVSRDLMLDAVWGYTYFPSTRTVDTHIWRLRKKIGDNGETPRWLKKVQGEGYVLTDSSD